MNLKRLTLAAIVSVGGLLATVVTAMAAPAIAIAAVNVRSGPGTNFEVVDQLFAGEQVDVANCQGSWCYINHSGPDGWVSSTYLNAGNSPQPKPPKPTPLPVPVPAPAPGNPDCGFGLNIGPNGPSFSVDCNDPNPPLPPAPPPPGPGLGYACFYSGTNFSGSSFCLDVGDYLPTLSGNWDDRISSIQIFDGAEVDICSNSNLNGQCRTLDASRAQLGNFDNQASSIEVY